MESRSKCSGWSMQGAGLAFMLLTLSAAPAVAQVPQDMTFSGRFAYDDGTPLLGPALVYLAIVDALTGGTTLYFEEHSVTLDAQGNFSVLLGTGAEVSGAPFPPFDVALFSDVERYVQVLLTFSGPPAILFQALTPRVPLSSVPWALVAERANEVVRDPAAPRFEDCGDGTVADHQTGLQWEKKTGTVGSDVYCDVVPCPDPHDVNNRYRWSLGSPYDPDGGAFTDFLARLNGDPTVVAVTAAEAHGDPAADPTVCFANHCDWHLPAVGELRTILIGPEAAPGQLDTCSSAPCIDPEFAAVGGPTAWANDGSGYWSASTFAGDPSRALSPYFSDGQLGFSAKTNYRCGRAVRAGSCN